MKRSNYSISRVTEDRVFIIDENDGALSVTNDAENVVRELNGAYPGKRIIYRDSMLQWDELIHRDGEFVDFAPYRESTWN
jgi:hypothetical protein